MKRYLSIATVLVAILLTVFAGAALAGEENLTLHKLADALATLTERTNRHDERLDALEEFVESLLTTTPTPSKSAKFVATPTATPTPIPLPQ